MSLCGIFINTGPKPFEQLLTSRAGMVTKKLEQVEALYLNELMSTHDAVEGLEAFIAKRKANWLHR